MPSETPEVAEFLEELQHPLKEGIADVLDDGVTSVHLAIESEDGDSGFSETKACGAFRARIWDRCEEPPRVFALREVGSYRLDQPGRP